MTKITLESYNSLIRVVKELQRICKKYREKNKELKNRLKRFEDIDKGIPGFLTGFGKSGGGR